MKSVPASEDDMGLKEVLKDDIAVLVLCAALFGGFGFGLANWSDQCMPAHVPTKQHNDTDVSYSLRIAAYEKEVESVGKQSCVSKPTAAFLTIGCAMGAVLALVVLGKRHGHV